MKKKRNYAIIVLIVLLLALAIGYAAFQSVLTINGSATGNLTWEVIFTSATLSDSNHGTITGITNNGLTVDATGITLAYPGDAVKLTTVITNNGSLDAMLTSVNVNTASLGNDITVTPATHTAGTVLAPNASCTNEFVVQWKPESTTANISGSFTVTFSYDQNTNTINLTPAHSDS